MPKIKCLLNLKRAFIKGKQYEVRLNIGWPGLAFIKGADDFEYAFKINNQLKELFDIDTVLLLM